VTRPANRSVRRLAPLAAALLLAAPVGAARADGGRDLDAWLAGLRGEALERGIPAATVEAALGEVRLLPAVVSADRSQPGAPSGFCRYLERRLTPTRIARGRRLLAEHRALLAELAAEHGVPARYLVALWGLESNYGDYQGDHPLFDALVTLAHDPRRGSLFREQVFAALRIVAAGGLAPGDLRGSWAGAMGQVQFMPTTYLDHAVDHDGDGVADIWASVPDALASAARYLRRAGWRSGETWGRPVRLPASLPGSARPTGAMQLAAWQELGVRRHDGGDLPAASLAGRLVLPNSGPEPAFLVYPNYRTFMAWNRSTSFAISVGALADALAGRAAPRGCGG